MTKSQREARYAKFVELYLQTNNATAAAQECGYSKRTAYSSGQRLLTYPHVAQAIAERRAVLARKHELKTEAVIGQLAAIVHVDPRELFDATGCLKAPKDWSDALAKAVISFDVIETTSKDGKAIPLTLKRVRLANKVEGLAHAMRHLGLFALDNQQQAGARAAAEPLTRFEANKAISFAVADAIAQARTQAVQELQPALPAPPAKLPETIQ